MKWLVWLGVASLAGCATPGPPSNADGSPRSSLVTAKASERAAVPEKASDEDRKQQEDVHLVVEAVGHAAPVRRLDVAQARGFAVTTSDDKSARVWDLRTGALRHVLRPRIGTGRTGALYGAAIHPTADLVAVGGSTGAKDTGQGHRILLFDTNSGALVSEFDARGGDVKDLAWSADGSLLFAVYDGDHALRGFERNGTMRFERRFSAPMYALASSSQGNVAAVAVDGAGVLLEASGGMATNPRDWRAGHVRPGAIAFSPDGRHFLVGYWLVGAAPQVFETGNGRFVANLQLPGLAGDSIDRVAWSPDGRYAFAGGGGYPVRADQVPVFRYDTSTWRIVDSNVVSSDRVLDLFALPDGRYVYSSFDGQWGVAGPAGIEYSVSASLFDLRGAANLRVGGNSALGSAAVVGWTADNGRNPVSFRFESRSLERKALDAAAPITRAGWLDQPQWENVREPLINGARIPLSAAEIGRSLAYGPAGDKVAFFGTSQRLMRIEADGTLGWQVRTAGEVRAVNVASDGHVLVTAMSDGTLRWWRASDGSLLLSLLATRSLKWVAWLPNGFYDASVGADRLVGWAVNREDASSADFFGLGTFRATRHNPQAIDEVLLSLDPQVAVRSVASRRLASVGTQAADGSVALSPGAFPPSVVALGARTGAVTGTQTPALAIPSTQAAEQPASAWAQDFASAAPSGFPPVLQAEGTSSASDDRRHLRLPFAVRSDGRALEFTVRSDGRPLPDGRVRLGGASGGNRTGHALVPMPTVPTVFNILAKNEHGHSEPLTFTYVPASFTGGVAGAFGVGAALAARESVAVTLGAALAARPNLQSTAIPSSPAVRQWDEKAPMVPEKPRLFVLAIGVGEYEIPDIRLRLPGKDARDFADAMRAQQGVQYKDVQIRLLTDREANRQAILSGLDWLSTSTQGKDVGMVFLAGHGLNGRDGNYYFLPFEADVNNVESTSVPESAIRRALAQTRGKVLLFVDTCYGGAALSRAGSTEISRMANDLASPENGVIVFAASSGRDVSEENDVWGNGAFTHALLKGLGGKADFNSTGRVTVKGLDFFISEEVRRLTNDRQRPVSITPVGVPDFPLARLIVADNSLGGGELQRLGNGVGGSAQ